VSDLVDVEQNTYFHEGNYFLEQVSGEKFGASWPFFLQETPGGESEGCKM
jgi:hypothetical protein